MHESPLPPETTFGAVVWRGGPSVASSHYGSFITDQLAEEAGVDLAFSRQILRWGEQHRPVSILPA